MPTALRTFDLLACKLGDSPGGANAAQLVGPRQLRIAHGHPRIASRTDGVAGEAAQDKGPYFARGGLTCEDVSTFAAVLAAFEAASGGLRAILAEGKEVGLTTVTDILIKRARLAGARMSIGNAADYSEAGYDYQVSCDPASDSQDDEVSFTNTQTKTETLGEGKRVYRVLSAIHNSVQALGCTGFDLDVRGRPMPDVGDGDFGETVEIAEYAVGGSVAFRDKTVSALLNKAQQLIAAAAADLVVSLRQQGGSATSTLTLANTQFFDVDEVYSTRDYAAGTLRFGCVFVSGTTPYTLATGDNKVIAMA